MKTPELPKTITKDSCSVTIYETPTKGYPGYTLVYRKDGRRERETSADYFALRTRADEVLDDLKEGRPTGDGALKAWQRSDYLQSVEFVKPTGQPLRVCASRYAKAYEILEGDFIIEAALDYKKRRLGKIQPRLVSEVVTDFIADKERQKRSEAHVQRLSSHLNRFAGSIVANIASVTAEHIDLFLDSLKSDQKPVGPRTRDNYADSIVTLYKWAKQKRYVPSDYDETDRITRLDNDEDGLIEIYSPDELKALLAKADAKLIPFLAIGAFAGLRSSEIMRLDWSDVKFENGSSCIVVQKGKVKKRGKSRRIVPMTDNLKSWLEPHAKRSGPIWPYSVPYLYEMLRELAPKAEAVLQETNARAKLEWKSNALRHSYISYRVASVKNVAQVALEAGNSPQMIFSNYRELVTEQDGAKWFGILPPAAR